MIPCKMPLFVTVVIAGLVCVFSISAIAYPVIVVSHIDTNSRGVRVLPYLRWEVVHLLLSSSLLVRDFANKQGVWEFQC